MSTYALGISVTVDALHAVLLEQVEEEVRVRMTRRIEQTTDPGLPGDEPMTPGMEDESDDVTIQFGEGGDGDDLFMDSEFGDVEEGGELGGDAPEHWNFQAALDDLLDACAEQDCEDPEIAFVASSDEIDEVELRLPLDAADDEPSEGPQGLPLPASRSSLLEMLEEQYEGGVEDERVGFVPMHRTGDGRPRVLALIAHPGGSTLSTLSTVQERALARSPRATLLDAEVSLYLGLARSALQLSPDAQEKTILVRAGTNDTLVLFMEGNTLRQAEHLPELTVEDPAETICSRVLLLQDEYGMGEVQHLLLVAEDDEEALADAFKSYFAGAHLRLLRTHLPVGDDARELNVAATGAAFRLLDDEALGPSFQPINLLPDRYRASMFRLPVGWSVPVLLGALAVTTLAFVWFYVSNANEISERRAELRSLEQQVQQVDQEALQRRIDSLQTATVQYNDALSVVDRLLAGSNKWSRGLATLTGRLDAIGGLYVSEWSPEGDNTVTVAGQAATRGRAAELARRLGGEINALTFTEVRGAELFDFVITAPLDTTRPEAIEYWREREAERLSAGGSTVSATQPTEPLATATGDTTATDTASQADASSPRSVSQEGGTPVWAIVVGSLAQKDAARHTARRIRDRLGDVEHPVQIHRSDQNGRYRVCVGAFDSFEAALSVLEARTALFPSDAWIYEFVPESDSALTSRRTARPLLPTR